MAIGYCQIQLHLPDHHSLKEKRGVLRSIMARLRQEFNIAVAELDHQDLWQSACLGVVSISNEAARLHHLLEGVVHWLEQNRPDVEVTGYQIEML
ncbi:MAG: DUF503 domain-containing protein [Chloroflexia bacterium]